MHPHRKFFYNLRNKLTDMAHEENNIGTWRHDVLEFIAYKIIDPLVWI